MPSHFKYAILKVIFGQPTVIFRIRRHRQFINHHKQHLPLSLRKFILLLITATTVPVFGGGLHEDVDKRTYSDFGQNKGRFRVTGISSMPQVIRDRDGGIAITKANSELTCVHPEAQGMINYSNTLDYGP